MKRRSPAVAALLSFAWPGAGHAYLGRRQSALVFALPILLATLGLATRLIGGTSGFVFWAITPSGALTLFLFLLLSGMWRLIAVVDSTLVARHDGAWFDPRSAALIGALVTAVLLTHSALGWIAYAGYDASSQIFTGGGSGAMLQSPNPAASDENQIVDPSGSSIPSSNPNSKPTDGRLTFLLLGFDSAPGRTESLTDSIMVISILPSTGAVAMVSVPRDISYFPVYSGGIYKGKINSFVSYAATHPAQFPAGPFEAMKAEIGFIVGVPVDHYAALNLGGFRTLIDTIGGITVDNPRAIIDPQYEWLDGTFGVRIPAGVQTLNGKMALAFARSRLGAGDNDFTRAGRQQILLLALRDKLTSPAMLPKLPSILDVAGRTVRTDIPPDLLQTLVELAKSVDKAALQQVVLGPPYSIHPPTTATDNTYILQLDEVELAKVSVQLFAGDSRYRAQ
jgi:LCP family protein required for cell wall assembly